GDRLIPHQAAAAGAGRADPLVKAIRAAPRRRKTPLPRHKRLAHLVAALRRNHPRHLRVLHMVPHPASNADVLTTVLFPSPGTPGEGRVGARRPTREDPHPRPPPEYRGRRKMTKLSPMSRKIKLSYPQLNISVIADLLDDDAPNVCNIVWNMLPVEGKIRHGI